MKKYPLIGILILLTIFPAHGGGSVEWDFHALPILKKHPELLAVIEKSLEVSQTGNGIRLGKDAGKEVGKRISPYEFPARIKGSTGPYDLILIIHDASGAHDMGDMETWIEIRTKKKDD
ncbi:MAG: hypothetical protein PHD76_00670 [Methylacidiphilales bacterium]|nr:hypothetical protein [Candidatus Methylacidiphilales bacterium]